MRKHGSRDKSDAEIFEQPERLPQVVTWIWRVKPSEKYLILLCFVVAVNTWQRLTPLDEDEVLENLIGLTMR